MRSERTAFVTKAVRRPLERKHDGVFRGRQRAHHQHHDATAALSGA